MAKDKPLMSTMKIEDIHRMESCMFWLERVAILTQVMFPGPQYLLSSTALLLLVTNTIDIVLFVERQFIRPFFLEPEAIFYTERPAILLLMLHYVFPGGRAYGAFISLVVLILTNSLMINRYCNIRELDKKLPTKSWLSSETNGAVNANT